MSQITELASGAITAADTIIIELVSPDDLPAAVRIHWPAAPTIAGARNFPDTAATVVKLFADAHIALDAIKARRPL
jgi:hypothetical protein